MIKKSTWIVGALAATLTLTACSDDKEGKQGALSPVETSVPELLKYAPADTPYVFVSNKAFPRELTGKLLKHGNEDLDRAIESYRNAMESIENEEAAADANTSTDTDVVDIDVELDPKAEKLIEAFFAELQGKLTPAGIESLGFSMEGRSLVYGLGILPVTRVEVKDPALVEAFIGRIEKRSELQAEVKQLGDQSYRWFDLEQLVGVIAIKDNYLIAALLPATAETEMLPLVLGNTLPEKSVADTDIFPKLYADYGFSGYGDGYIDMVKLTGFILGEGSTESMAIRQALEIDTTEVTPACENFVKAQVQSWPRLVMGFPEVSANRYRLRGVMEASPDVAALVAKLAAPVPGLGEDTSALLSFGLGANLPEYREAMKAGIQAMIDNGKGCEWIDEKALTESMQGVDLMFNPMFSGIRGMYLKVSDLQIDTETMMPSVVDGKLLLAVDDPKGIFGMLGMVNHKFTQLKIPEDGSPVQLPMDEVAPGVPPVYVAIKDKVLGFSIGADANKGLPDFMGSDIVSPSPLLSIGYDVAKIMTAAAPLIEVAKQEAAASAATADDDEITVALVDGLDSLQSSGDVYGKMTLDITASEHGLVLDQVVNLK